MSQSTHTFPQLREMQFKPAFWFAKLFLQRITNPTEQTCVNATWSNYPRQQSLPLHTVTSELRQSTEVRKPSLQRMQRSQLLILRFNDLFYPGILLLCRQVGGRRALDVMPWFVDHNRKTFFEDTLLFDSLLNRVLPLSSRRARPFLSVFLPGWRRNYYQLQICTNWRNKNKDIIRRMLAHCME